MLPTFDLSILTALHPLFFVPAENNEADKSEEDKLDEAAGGEFVVDVEALSERLPLQTSLTDLRAAPPSYVQYMPEIDGLIDEFRNSSKFQIFTVSFLKDIDKLAEIYTKTCGIDCSATISKLKDNLFNKQTTIYTSLKDFPLMFTNGRELFNKVVLLLQDSTIPEITKQRSLEALFDEMGKCAEGVISRLSNTYTELNSSTGAANYKGKMSLIRRQLILALATESIAEVYARLRAHESPVEPTLGMEVHYVNALAYHVSNDFGIKFRVDRYNDCTYLSVEDYIWFYDKVKDLVKPHKIFSMYLEEKYQCLLDRFQAFNILLKEKTTLSLEDFPEGLTGDLDRFFFTPINKEFCVSGERILTMVSISETDEDFETYDFSQSKQKLSRWMLDTICDYPIPTEVAKIDNGTSEFPIKGKIMSQQGIYFWFEDEEGLEINLTLSHLRTIDWWTWPEIVSIPLIEQAVSQTTSAKEILGYFCQDIVLNNLDKLPQTLMNNIKDIMSSRAGKSYFLTAANREVVLNYFSTNFNYEKLCLFKGTCIFDKALLMHLSKNTEQKLHQTCSLNDLIDISAGTIKALCTNIEVNSMLKNAILSGNSRSAWKLIQSGADINAKGFGGNTALHVAITDGNLTIFKELIKTKGVDLNIKNNSQETPLILAADKPAFLELLLLQKNIKVNTKDEKGLCALFIAVKQPSTKCLRLLLNHKKIDLTIKGKGNETVLHLAAEKDSSEHLNHLLQCQEVKINAQDSEGLTPLMSAAKADRLECFKLLMKHKRTKVLKVDKKQRSVLSVAAQAGASRIIRLLNKDKRIDVNHRSDNQQTPLMLAILAENYEATKALLEHPDINLSAEDSHGKSAIVYSYEFENLTITPMLEAFIKYNKPLLKPASAEGIDIAS